MLFNLSRITVITGHYGTGKSELALNLALALAKESKASSGRPSNGELSYEESTNGAPTNGTPSPGKSVWLADLDVVNPYFRSREQLPILQRNDINVISSGQAFPGVDLPYLPETLKSILDDPNAIGIIDPGGDPAGARVLARYAEDLKKQGASVIFVVNANRPLSKTPEEGIAALRKIEEASGLKITHLVNNTHLLSSTLPEDIERGALVTKAISEKTGLPFLFNAVEESLVLKICEHAFKPDVEDSPLKLAPIFPIKIHLNKPWKAM